MGGRFWENALLLPTLHHLTIVYVKTARIARANFLFFPIESCRFYEKTGKIQDLKHSFQQVRTKKPLAASDMTRRADKKAKYGYERKNFRKTPEKL